MNKSQIKSLLQLIKECGGEFKCHVLPTSSVGSAKKCCELYKGWSQSIEIDKLNKGWSIKGPKTGSKSIQNIEKATQLLLKEFKDDVLVEFYQAMKNLGWEDNFEIIKMLNKSEYKKDFVKFKKEIKRLAKENKKNCNF